MPDEFYDRFGQVDVGPRDTRRPDDGFALYERGSNIRRYDLEDASEGGWWGVDIRTGERAFRFDGKHRYFLPDGRQIASPKPLPPPKAADTTRRLYQSPSVRPAHQKPLPKAAAVAQRLYGKRGPTVR